MVLLQNGMKGNKIRRGNYDNGKQNGKWFGIGKVE